MLSLFFCVALQMIIWLPSPQGEGRAAGAAAPTVSRRPCTVQPGVTIIGAGLRRAGVCIDW